jgi:hypothetical protein
MRKFPLAIVMLIGACYGSQHWATQVRTRASFDLQCGEQQLDARPLGDNANWGVRGCGKQASYVWSDSSKSFVLNSPIQATAPIESAPPPTASLPPSAAAPPSTAP